MSFVPELRDTMASEPELPISELGVERRTAGQPGRDFVPQKSVETGQSETVKVNTSKAMIVVGPGKHFGAELIHRFAIEGFAVGVICSSKATAEKLRRQVGPVQTLLIVEVANIAEPVALRQALQELMNKLPPLVCLIYNPKMSISETGLNTTSADFSQSIAVNVTGALVAIQLAASALERRRGATIILTGGGFKDLPDSGRLALSVGKAGLHSLARGMRDPLRQKGINLKTLVIEGITRRNSKEGAPSEALAEFFWRVFSQRDGLVHRFPSDMEQADTGQLDLPV